MADAVVGAPFADTSPETPNSGATYIVSAVQPNEVLGLLLARSGALTELEWLETTPTSIYNVYRGSLATLQAEGVVRTSDMTAVACGIDTDADMDGLPDDQQFGDPPPGEGFFYLVTAENLNGEGPLGTLGGAIPRINDQPCP